MDKGFSGGCLCGAVRYDVTAAPIISGHCYCLDCRRASGTGHGSHLVVPEPALRVSGKVAVYERPADSGNIVGRAFCPACGSAIYSTNSGLPGAVFLRASSLDDPEVFKPEMSAYASRAPSWDRPDPALPAFATMPEGGPEKVLGDRLGK